MKKKYFSKYSLELVREDECLYEGVISSSTDAYNKFLEVFKLNKKAEEHIVMFCLDTKNKIVGAFLIAKGGARFANLERADIIKRALLCNCNKIIVAHNHPSGSIVPSKNDIEITKKIKEACLIVGVELLDHLIIGEKNYFSIMNHL